MRRTLILTGALLLTFAFAARPALAQFFTGFEAGEGYVGAPGPTSLLVPQNGWQEQFGGANANVHTYVGREVPWIPQSVGGVTNFIPPAHPGGVFSGGDQFIGFGGNNGRDLHAATYSGLVEVSTDIVNGPEHDYPLFQGAITSRSSTDGGGNLGGIYTRSASTYVDPGAPPRQGDWAFSVVSYDADGNQMRTGLGNTSFGNTTFRQPGFDELPRETWWRMGYVLDTDTRQIVELKSMNLETGEFWNIVNPQGETDPSEGLEDMYILGGAAGTHNLDLVGIYNVGNGQVHAFDNVYVGDPIDWVVPEPSSFVLGLLALLGLGAGRWGRRRRSGK